VRRAEITGSFPLTGDVAATSGKPNQVPTANLSSSAKYSVSRPDESCRIASVTNSTTFTVDCNGSGGGVGSGRLSSTTIRLVSGSEVGQIKDIKGREIELQASTKFNHRSGDAVSLLRTAWATFGAGEVDSIVPGDSLLLGWNTGSSSFYSGTIFRALVAGVDTEASRLLLANPSTGAGSPFSGIVYGSKMRAVYLGDSVVVSGAADTSGNAFSTKAGQYLNLNSGGIQ
jgi:hypothetical protein